MEKIRALGNKPAAEAEGGTGAPSRPVMQAPFQASFALNTTTAKQMLAGPVRPMSPYRPPKLTGFRDEHPYAPRGVAACCLRGYLRGSRHSRSMFSAFRADPVNCNCALRLQLCGMHCSFPLLLLCPPPSFQGVLSSALRRGRLHHFHHVRGGRGSDGDRAAW